MTEGRIHLVDLVASVGIPPEGVDVATNVIAAIPHRELNEAVRDSSFTYEGLVHIKNENPELYQFIKDNPHPENALAQEIGVRQQQLSRVTRRLAVAACSLSLFAGGTVYGYETLTSVDKDLRVGSSTIDRIERGAILGAPAGIFGGLVTMFAFGGRALSGKFARRPAIRIVDEARQRERLLNTPSEY
jgi:hypothetical protein